MEEVPYSLIEVGERLCRTALAILPLLLKFLWQKKLLTVVLFGAFCLAGNDSAKWNTIGFLLMTLPVLMKIGLAIRGERRK